MINILYLLLNNIIYYSKNLEIILTYIWNIYYFFFINFLYYLNCHNVIIKIIYFINLDIFYINNYSKYLYLKDYLYSWLRLPIQDMLAINKDMNVISTKLLPKGIKAKPIWYESFFPNADLKYYKRTINNRLRFSLFYLIDLKQTNFSFNCVDSINYNALFYVFRFVWLSLIYQYLILLIILSFIFYKYYTFVYKKTVRSCLYVSNVSLWDTFNLTTINNNFILYKKDSKFYNYYYNETVKDIEDLSNINYRYVSDRDDQSDIKEDDAFSTYWLEEKEKHSISLYKLNLIRYKKLNYIKLYKKYIY